METRAHHVLIGLFTLLVVGAALMFALWLGKSDADRQFEVYDIVFQEAVSGLSKGGTVEFNGIKIGDVSSLRLDPQDPASRGRIEAWREQPGMLGQRLDVVLCAADVVAGVRVSRLGQRGHHQDGDVLNRHDLARAPRHFGLEKYALVAQEVGV